MIRKRMIFTVYDYDGRPIEEKDDYSCAQSTFHLNDKAAFFVGRQVVEINGKEVYTSSDCLVYTRTDFESELVSGTIVITNDAGDRHSLTSDGILIAGNCTVAE